MKKYNTNMVKIGFVFLTAFFLISCASSKKISRPPSPPKAKPIEYDEKFDPLTLDDEDLEFPETKPTEPRPDTFPGEENIEISTPPLTENKLIDGYRVQLFATKDIESATVVKKEAEFVFLEDQVNVYIEFDTPYYKLRVGDCKTREQAEQLREVARRKGYPSAWIVKTKVWSNPRLPELQEPNLQRNQ